MISTKPTLMPQRCSTKAQYLGLFPVQLLTRVAFALALTLLISSFRLVTWWHTMMGNYGYCFDLQARNQNVIIHKLHGCSFTRKVPQPHWCLTLTLLCNDCPRRVKHTRHLTLLKPGTTCLAASRKPDTKSCPGLGHQGPLHYKIWTTTGTWRYKCHSERLWTLIGEGDLKLNFREGYYTELPLNQTVKIRAHSTQAFYIHTPGDDFGVGFRTQ